jgi:hypothetical protein
MCLLFPHLGDMSPYSLCCPVMDRSFKLVSAILCRVTQNATKRVPNFILYKCGKPCPDYHNRVPLQVAPRFRPYPSPLLFPGAYQLRLTTEQQGTPTTTELRCLRKALNKTRGGRRDYKNCWNIKYMDKQILNWLVRLVIDVHSLASSLSLVLNIVPLD